MKKQNKNRKIVRYLLKKDTMFGYYCSYIKDIEQNVYRSTSWIREKKKQLTLFIMLSLI